jgi:hypothetical protein
MTEEERMVERACEAYRVGYAAGEAGEQYEVPKDEKLVVKSYLTGYTIGERLRAARSEAARFKGVAL